MGNQTLTSGDTERSKFVDRQLRVIEGALESGDVSAAQRHLRTFRHVILVADSTDVRPDAELSGGVVLTGQEAATLRLLPDGSLSQKDIARAMGVSRNTLKTHVKSLYLKLGAHCRSEAIHRARDAGLLPRPFTSSELSRVG
jgi:DNA-binding CsgD family transcriptional regulator